MEVDALLNQIAATVAATVRRTMREELRKFGKEKRTLSDVWANEEEVLQLCGRSRWTLLKAIKDGRISGKDIRPNPIGTGYLFRRSAIVKD